MDCRAEQVISNVTRNTYCRPSPKSIVYYCNELLICILDSTALHILKRAIKKLHLNDFGGNSDLQADVTAFWELVDHIIFS